MFAPNKEPRNFCVHLIEFMIMYNAQHTCFHILLLLLTVVHSGDADTSTFDAASHNHESYMMGTAFCLYSYCVLSFSSF